MAKSLGALAALADYGSDSEDSDSENEEKNVIYDTLEMFISEGILSSIVKESVRRVEYAKSINYRNHETIEIDDTTSSGDESSESDSSSSDDDYLNLESKDSTDLTGGGAQKPQRRRKPPPKVKGELALSDLPPIDELHISVPDYECLKIGVISSMVEEMVVVQADANTPGLDLDTVLFLENGKRPLGKVFDVMGPVMHPFYCIRFNSKEHIKEKNIVKGAPVFYAPRTEHTSFVFLSELMKMKGSDASWENDNEPPPSHMDYSDDESERKSRRSYVPPTGRDRSNNAFYRRERHYNPRNYGPIQWNSVHTQHM